MNTIKYLAILALICLAGVYLVNERDQKDQAATAAENERAEAQSDPGKFDLPAPSLQPLPSIPVGNGQWYTLRRLSQTTDTGITAVQAGEPVQRVEEDGLVYAIHQGRKYPAKYDDLTDDPLKALNAKPVTPFVPIASVEAPQRAAAAPLRDREAERSAEDARRHAQRNAIVKALDDQIDTLQSRMQHEMKMSQRASNDGRISSRGVTVQRLQKEIDGLQQQKMALLRAR